MKSLNIKTSLLLFTILSISLFSCVKEVETNKEQNFVNFDFRTTKQIKVAISTLNPENQPIGGIPVEIYTQNPLTAEGTLKDNSADFLAFQGISSDDGTLDCSIAPATAVDSLSILVNHVGFPTLKQVKFDAKDISVVVGGALSLKTNKTNGSLRTTGVIPDPRKVSGYYVIGGWDNQGKPDYLWTPNDVISNAFLADVNASLPENIKLPISHPEYLSSTDDGSVELIADAEVWITFVHEGAGYKNAIGYYTHQNGTPPATASAITDQTIIYPNVSYSGSGGSLRSGNKVQLLYLDPATNKYTTIFPAGTTVAWFLIANSFNGTTNSIGSGLGKFYSDTRFNPETNIDKKKHNVVLKDTQRQLLLIGFEDINRQGSSDEDFNDALFYCTASPYTAISTNKLKSIDTPKDADGDGVTDSRDEYPNDPARAFNNYYPAKNATGTLAYEDLWPYKGDYDFNDLVVDYNFNQVTNGDNKVVEVKAALTLRAIGASLKNAFSLQFNTPSNNVKSITGQNLINNLFSLNTNGTERNQSKAVVPIFDDPFKVLNYTGSIVNTYVGGAYAAPKTLNVNIEFITPVSLTNFGTAPYNAFIIAGGVRGKEIHLAGGAPTDLADQALFGTGADNSNLGIQKYYMSDKNLPWAINIPVQFAYPAEKQDITKAFLKFNQWAESKGSVFKDWYLNTSGYRDSSKLYSRP